MPKKILTLFLLIVLLFSLSGCEFLSFLGFKQSGQTIKDDPLVGDGTSYADFITVMTEIKGYGDKTASLGLTVQSEYYYSFAAASVGALRYAAENVLWLKGEGDTLDTFTADSRFTGWARIAELNYTSPYPSYFEGLLLEVQGKTDECADPYASAAIMPLFPEEGLDFYYLKKLSVNTLYELHDHLRELEESIYAVYTPVLTGREWDRLYFDKDYLIALSYQSVQAERYADALFYAKNALKADPFDATVWHNAVMCAVYAEQIELAGVYIDEGLAAFPADAQLTEFKQMMLDAVSDKEAKP